MRRGMARRRGPAACEESSTTTERGVMQQTTTKVRLDEMRGAPVYDNEGEKIGNVEEIFYDAETRVPESIGIGTGFFQTKRVLVPVRGASAYDDGLMVAYAKDHVKDSPDIDGDDVSGEREAELAAYYGVGSTAQRPQPTGGHESVTRSEEELEVGTRSVETGTARLRKWVETEPVALDVGLTHEVARVTRERIEQPVADHDFTKEEIEVPLHEEKPVVSKQTVA